MAPRKKPTTFECGICQEDQTRRVVLECKHDICFECATSWKKQGKMTCPMCRADSHILSRLRNRCPPLNADGVSRVAAKRARKTKSPLTLRNCPGCDMMVAESSCVKHPQCGKFTCRVCNSIIAGMTGTNSGCIPCLCVDMGIEVEDIPGGVMRLIGVDLEDGYPFVVTA